MTPLGQVRTKCLLLPVADAKTDDAISNLPIRLQTLPHVGISASYMYKPNIYHASCMWSCPCFVLMHKSAQNLCIARPVKGPLRTAELDFRGRRATKFRALLPFAAPRAPRSTAPTPAPARIVGNTNAKPMLHVFLEHGLCSKIGFSSGS